MNSKRIVVALVLLLCGCGGGGGGGSGNPPSPLSISGSLLVPPNNRVEAEPNNGIKQFQIAAEGDTLSGQASDGDAGFPTLDNVRAMPATVTIHDTYKITVTKPGRVELYVGAQNLQSNDLDLFLMDVNGTVIASSIDVFDIEVVEIPAAGAYLVGVQAYAGTSSYLLSFAAPSSPTTASVSGIPTDAEFVPGELLVQAKSTIVSKSIGDTSRGMSALIPDGQLVQNLSNGVSRYQIGSRVQSFRALGAGKVQSSMNQRNSQLAATISAVLRLSKDPRVAFAEPNFIRRPLRVPNDQYFPLQWHYKAINLPQAWDVSTGSSQVIIAVIDTGLISSHPDFAGKLVPGYDFISDLSNSNDGDGRDTNPEDPGDDPRGVASTFHGTHVAGTIAARTDNGVGVAGIAWGSRIMPLRVLGTQGGTDADIAEAILYAAQLSNISPAPGRKADIINMSLGGTGSSQTMADAIARVRAAGTIVIAAAGNSNSANPSFPASYPGVVSVAATGFDLGKAPYSNYGPNIDVAAPGGDTSVDFNHDAQPDGVLSTSGNDQKQFGYVFHQGTSMAAPHVAGVAALMRSVYPQLTPEDFDRLLAGTHPTVTNRITTDLGTPGRDNVFGHGLIDAAGAVAAAQQLANRTTITTPILAVSTTSLDFQTFVDSISVKVTNAGGGNLTITAISTDQPWLRASVASGSAPLQFDVRVDRSGITPGNYTAHVLIASNATPGPSTATIDVTLQVQAGSSIGDIGTVLVRALDPITGAIVGADSTDAGKRYRFEIRGLPPGTYQLLAGTDRDQDGIVCDVEDACGAGGDFVIQTNAVASTNFLVSNSRTRRQASQTLTSPQSENQ